VRIGDSIAIFSLGAIGLMAVQLAKLPAAIPSLPLIRCRIVASWPSILEPIK